MTFGTGPTTSPIQPTPWAEIKSAILYWFSESTKLDVIWANQDMPQPDWPYGILNRISGPTKIGQDGVRYEYNETTEKLDATFCGLREFTVSCQIDLGKPGTCKGFDAEAVLGSAQMALVLPQFRERFQKVDLAVATDAGPINVFDLVVGDVWMSRAQMDVVFRTSANFKQSDVGGFDNVKISSNLSNADQSLNLDDENFGG